MQLSKQPVLGMWKIDARAKVVTTIYTLHTYIHTYIYTHTYIHTYIHKHTYTHTYIHYIDTYIHIYILTNKRATVVHILYTDTYTFTHIYKQSLTNTNLNEYLLTYTGIHIDIYNICIYINIYIYIYISTPLTRKGSHAENKASDGQ